ncbi:MAG TPA: PIG-L family deacetylase [Flavobacteriales bacterium]|nr:PIG-L family deacetylase [Flavobacteriales bacterium]HRJ38646.1 PIG-L family deacetylase [Flavobacteriales bacterium]
MKTIFLFLSLFCIGSISAAGQSLPKTSAHLYSDLQKLKTVGSVLYIAAHPDDENTRLISYLTKERKFEVAYLSLTRGDGGQNLIGDEQGEDLGIIRTQELLEARKIDGAIQFFTRAFDFGYSKSPQETFMKWNKEEVLADIVFVIRLFKPDIIICRFPTTGEGGHGHHTASAILAEEAFDAAADPNRFPEQLAAVSAWKTKRLLWNTFNFGTNNTTAEDQLKIDAGGFNPLSGKSNGEIAAEARSMHRSQAFGTERRRGEQFEYFKTLKGSPASNDIMDGIATDWTRFKATSSINAIIEKIEKKFRHENPELIIPDLIRLYQVLNKYSSNKEPELQHWVSRKTNEINTLIQNCAGLFIEFTTDKPVYSIYDTVNITIKAINRSKTKIQFASLFSVFGKTINQFHEIHDQILEPNQLKTATIKMVIPETYLPSNPYQYRYSNENQTRFRWPMPIKPQYKEESLVSLGIKINGQLIVVQRDLHYKKVDPSFGEIYQPFVIAPEISLNFTEEQYIFNGSTSRKIRIRAKAFRPIKKALVSLEYPNGWQVTEKEIELSFSATGEEKEIEFEITPSTSSTSGKQQLKAFIDINGKRNSWMEHFIQYDHIENQHWFTESVAGITATNIKTNTKSIGYLAGAGDKIPGILRQLGYEVTLLNEKLLNSLNLSQFDAIVTGVRAFNTESYLKHINKKLFAYAETGGILVIQYNTSTSLVTDQLGPYPFKLSRDRVTEEDSPVELLQKDHPLMRYPNYIAPEDFEGWVQERGLYFPGQIDERYETILQMGDTGGPSSTTSIITAKYGKGKFVYTGISFFRQLPAGVPGALKLFVNLISKNEK